MRGSAAEAARAGNEDHRSLAVAHTRKPLRSGIFLSRKPSMASERHLGPGGSLPAGGAVAPVGHVAICRAALIRWSVASVRPRQHRSAWQAHPAALSPTAPCPTVALLCGAARPSSAGPATATTAVKVVPRMEAPEAKFFTSLPTHLDDIAEAP